MARNASGTHSLPSGNPVVTGTTISSTVHNATVADISSELTDSLSRSGKGGMLAAMRGVDGSVAAPAVSFTDETGTGLYRPASNQIGVTVAGTLRASFGTNGLSLRQTGATANAITSFVADGATAVGVAIDTDGALANASAKLVSFQNNSVEKAAIGEDGQGQFYGADMKSQKITSLANGSSAQDAATVAQITPTADTLTLATGWTATSGRVHKVAGIVFLNVHLTGGAAASNFTSVATLSAGYRPGYSVNVWGVVRDVSGPNIDYPCLVTIGTSGGISIAVYDNGSGGLDSIFAYGNGDFFYFSAAFYAEN
jgi:hypothetical protein